MSGWHGAARGQAGRGFGRGRAGLAVVLLGLLAVVVLVAVAGGAGGVQPYATYESTVAADGPVAQYRFDDAAGSTTLADSAGTRTATNTKITLGGTGPFGGSKSGAFAGSAYATLPSSPLAGVTAFSAEAWVDWTGGSSYQQPIFDFGSSTTNWLSLTPASSATNHPLTFEIHTTAGTSALVTATTLASKAWEYVAVTETSAGVLTLYLNGKQAGQTTGVTLTPSSLGTTGNVWLGKSQVSTDPLFNGSLSNVAFYSKALSAAQVLANYNAAEFPVNTVLPTITGTAKDGQKLTAASGTWTGIAPITFGYQWNRCNTSGGSCSAITSATSSTYSAVPADVGSTLEVGVTGSNSAGSGSATSAPTGTVSALAPANTAVPVISGSAKEGQLLSASTGTWTGTPTITFGYQWESCSGSTCSSISGATASTYRLVSAQVGKTIKVIVTGTNAGGSATATSAATATVTTGAPVNTALPSISGTAKDGQVLTATPGTWAGTATITYSYQWQTCNASGASCTNISGATAASYTVVSGNVGDTLAVVVTAKNSVGSTTATAPVTPVVVAAAPANTVLPAVTGTAQAGQTLSVSNGTWTGTPTITYAYQWERCNTSGTGCTNVSGATSSTYALGSADLGSTLRAVVSATNTAGTTPATSAATATVTAVAPVNTAVPVISGTAKDGQSLSASTGTWSGTAPLSYAYQWESCNTSGASCTNLSGATAASYTVVSANVGATIRVLVTASNSAGSGAPASSAASAVVVAAAPSNITLPVITGTATDGQTLTASTGTWSGTPTITYTYQWQSCNSLGSTCANDSGATSNTYVLHPSDVGTTLRVIVTATNTAGSGPATSAVTAVVAALAPANTVLPVISGTATDGQTLSVSTGTWSGTPPLTYAYQWQRCNSSGGGCVAVSGATGATYALHPADVGQTLVVAVTASNSAASPGPTVTSAPSGVVGALAPANLTPPVISGTAQQGQTLTASTGTWSGSTPLTFTYQWQRCDVNDANCAAISGATASTYQAAVADVGSTLRVQVTASNSAGPASSISAATAVVTGAPVNSVPPWITGSAVQGRTLTANTGTWSGSAPITYAYQWQDCNASGQSCSPIGGASSATYTPAAGDIGATIQVIVTAYNTVGSTPQASSVTAEVQGYGGGAACTDTWTGGGGDGLWSTAANWTNDVTPGASDHACILSAVTVALNNGSAEQAGWLTDQGTLSIGYGSLSLNGPSASVIQNLTLSGEYNTLTGSGEVDVPGALYTAGYPTLAGSGTLVLSPGSTANVSADGGQTYVSRTIDNQGSMSVLAGSLVGSTGAVLDNSGTLTVNAPSTNNGGLTGTGSLVNTGTVQTTSGSSQIDWAIDNEASVSVSSGQLTFSGGGNSGVNTPGSWTTTASGSIVLGGYNNAVLSLGATVPLSGNITVNGQGGVTAGVIHGAGANVTVTSGTLEVDGLSASTLGNLSVSGQYSTLDGSGEIDVTSTFTSSGYATLSGSGALVLFPGATGSIDPGDTQRTYVSRPIDNEGLLSVAQGGLDGATGASIQNSGTLSVNAENVDNNDGIIGTGSIVNTGTVQKTSGTGEGQIGWAFDNEGTVNVTSGQLMFNGGGTSGLTNPGSWSTSSEGSVALGGGSFSLGVTVPVSGNLTVSGGSVTTGAIQGADANLTVAGGTLGVDGSTPSPLSSLTVTGSSSTLTGSGEINITNAFSASDSATLAGTGVLVINSGAAGEFNPASATNVYMAKTLENLGLLSLESGGVLGSAPAQIDNVGTFTIDAESNGNNQGLAGTGLVVNQGLLRKVAGTGTSLIGWPIDNESQVEADTGTLEFDGGGNSGQLTADTWNTAPDATIALDGDGASYSLGASATLTGNFIEGTDITVGQLNGAAANITDSFGNLTFSGLTPSTLNGLTAPAQAPSYYDRQTITATGEVDIDGYYNESSGNADLAGPGTFVFGPSAVVTINAINNAINASTIVNEGTVNWTYGQLGTANNQMQFINYGTFNLNDNADGQSNGMGGACAGYILYQQTCADFINYGVVAGSATSQPVGSSWDFFNYGYIDGGCQTYEGIPYVGTAYRSCDLDPASPGYAYIGSPASSDIMTVQGWPYFTDYTDGDDEQWGGGNDAEPNTVITGDDVNDASGNETQSQTDINVGGLGLGLNLTRTYNSQAAAQATSPGIFGYGWQASYTDHLVITPAGGPYQPEKVTVVQADGSQIPFYQLPDGSFASGPQDQATLVQNPAGTYTYTLPTQQVDTFASSGRLEAEADSDGNTTTFDYNGEGKLATVTDPTGRTIQLSYDAQGQVATATDPAGQTLQYGYDAVGNLTSVTYAGEATPRWTFAYDATHEMTALTDGNGGTTTYTYDGSNRVVDRIDPLERETKWTYDVATSGQAETLVTNPNGAVTDELFEAGEPTQITRASGTPEATATEMAYSPAGELVSTTDGNGGATTYTYDTAGNRTSETNPDGDTTSWTYDAKHNLVTTTTPMGETTTDTYDADDDLLTESRPAPNGSAQETTYAYNALGELLDKTDPDGHTWTYGYDRWGNQTSATDPTGGLTTSTYDADSRLATQTAARGNALGAAADAFTTVFTRDERGRVIEKDVGGRLVTTYGYDGDDNQTDVTDPNGDHTHTHYDADDEPTEVNEPDGTTVTTGYDAEGDVVTQTNGADHTTWYVRDLLGDVESTTDPLMRTTAYSYDADGNRVSETDAAGRVSTYGFNGADQLTSVTYPDGGAPNVTYGYNADGQRASMTDATGTTAYSYDVLSRLSAVTSGTGIHVGYGYDPANNQVSVTYPNGETIHRTFDPAERMISVTDWLGNTTAFGYDPDSDLTAITFPAGTGEQDAYTFDSDDAMTSATFSGTAGNLASIGYVRDSDEDITDETDSDLPGNAGAYTYDKRQRLTGDSSLAFAYDGAGNATTLRGAPATYDAAEELRTVGGAVFDDDALGERQQSIGADGTVTNYDWNEAGQLVAVNRGGATPISDTYTYNGDNLRQSETNTAGTTTAYAWDATGAVPTLIGANARYYIDGPSGVPVEEISDGDTVTYYHHDAKGSTRLITDATGTVVGRYTYDGFGALTGATGQAAPEIGWSGQLTDSDSGLVYLRAREYDPATAVFLTRDPEIAWTGTPYSYADDDPVNGSDLSGQYAAAIGAASGGADISCGSTWEVPGIDIGTCGVAGAIVIGIGIGIGIDDLAGIPTGSPVAQDGEVTYDPSAVCVAGGGTADGSPKPFIVYSKGGKQSSPPELSDAEQKALDQAADGLPVTNKQALKSAKKKLVTLEKFGGTKADRNKQKRSSS